MKTIEKLVTDYLPKKEEIKLIHAIQDIFVLRYLDSPITTGEVICPICGENEGDTAIIDPKLSDKRLWFCLKRDCMTTISKSRANYTQPTPANKRSILWPLFCEINGIGDLHHGVKFEDIEQSQGKIDYLLKFAKKPSGIVFMQGSAGSGKTYASMAVCELFTRNNTSAIFSTQKQMLKNWLDTFKSDRVSNYIDILERVNLLVIDDFGTGDISPGFMSFFMDLINSRMQWSDRGTIISTNLHDDKFIDYCGEALNDRIKTGQKMLFNNETRRKQLVL